MKWTSRIVEPALRTYPSVVLVDPSALWYNSARRTKDPGQWRLE